MDIAWNPPGLNSAIDRLMDLWDENVSVPMRRAQPAQPPQPESPVDTPADDLIRHQDPAGQGCISALAVLAGG